MLLDTGNGLARAVDGKLCEGLLSSAAAVSQLRHPSLPSVEDQATLSRLNSAALSDFRGDDVDDLGDVDEHGAPTTEVEKRMRREIANSNERRRMQSINVGFQSLRALLPKRDGEKMSKASILQQTADYVLCLQKEKERLVKEISEVKASLDVRGGATPASSDSSVSPTSTTTRAEILAPPKKRRRYELHTDSSSSDDGGVGSSGDLPSPKRLEMTPENRRQVLEMQTALEREMATRKILEDQIRSMELSRMQSLSRLQSSALLDYSAALGLGGFGGPQLGFFPPQPKPDLLSAPVSIAHPAPLKPTLLLGGTSALPPPSVSSFYSGMGSLLSTSAPTPLHIPTIPSAALPASSASHTKQNLEVIVEAIRHLEGEGGGWKEEVKAERVSPNRPEFASPLVSRTPVIVPH